MNSKIVIELLLLMFILIIPFCFFGEELSTPDELVFEFKRWFETIKSNNACLYYGRGKILYEMSRQSKQVENFARKRADLSGGSFL